MKTPIRWPKSHERGEWVAVNNDLVRLLDHLKAAADKKVDTMGEFLYNYGTERFGTTERTRKSPTVQNKTRRQQDRTENGLTVERE